MPRKLLCVGHGAANLDFPEEGGAAEWRANEPAGYTELADRTFTSLDGTSEGWDDQSGSSNGSLVSDATAPQSPPDVMRVLFREGEVTSGSLTPISHKLSGWGSSEFYACMAFKVSSNWQGHSSGVNKVIYCTEQGTGNPFFFLVRGQDAGTLTFELARQQSGISGGAQKFFTWDHGSNLVSPSEADATITRDQWHIIEVRVIGNTISGSETFDGEAHGWLDGVKILEFDSEIWWPANHSGGGLFENFRWEPVWGGQLDTVDADMYQFFDHIYVSTP